MKSPQEHETLRHILRDIEKPQDADYDLDLAYVPDVEKRLPLPHMVLLTMILGTESNYEPRPYEKTAWAITLRFNGVPMRLEYGKFGMRLATPAPVQQPLIDEFIKTLGRAFPVTDRLLQPIVEAQVSRGNVTVPNMFSPLDGRYRFLRERAESAFASEPTVAQGFVERLRQVESGGTQRGFTYDILKAEREGFYFGSAAIDAYFSRLEHLLVLMLPFVGFDPAEDNLLEFMSWTWTGKLKRVLDLSTDPDGKILYDRLREIKERYRNPLSHGGFEKEGASLLVHIPQIGSIPTRLSKFGESIHYDFFPVTEISFKEACQVFELVDLQLQKARTRFGWKWAEAGLDVAFDHKSLDKYHTAMTSDIAFEALLDKTSHLADAARNMEW